MIRSGGYRNIRAVGRDRNRGMPSGGGAVAQLAKQVVAPRPQVARPVQRQGIIRSGGYRNIRAVGRDRNRGMPFGGGGAVAQLAIPVVAPRPQVAGRIQCQGMMRSGGYRGVRAVGRDRQRNMPGAGGPVAQPFGIVVAPRPQVAGRIQCAGVRASTGNRGGYMDFVGGFAAIGNLHVPVDLA